MRRLRDQQGSMLIEVMMSAVIVLVVGLGVLDMVDRTTKLSGEQRTQAIMGNLAQEEIERVKALPTSQLTDLKIPEATLKEISNVTYTITTSAVWMNDTAVTPKCNTPGTKAAYLKVRTSVTYPGLQSRPPAVLSTIVTPPVRAVDATSGALAVYVADRNDVPTAGLTVNLSGPKMLTEVTSDQGCILWGYLPAGVYTVSFSKAGHVTDTGSATGGTVTVEGGTTTHADYPYDRGGSLITDFKVRTPPTGSIIDTRPKNVSVDNSTGIGFSKLYDIGATSRLNTLPAGLLFPFVNPYSIYADVCPAAKPPTPTTGALTPGDAVDVGVTYLPALDIRVTNGTPVVPGATVRVVTACASTYVRTTNALGKLDDPGFPYGATDTVTVCATNGSRKRVVTLAENNNFANAGTPVSLNLLNGLTTNLNACP